MGGSFSVQDGFSGVFTSNNKPKGGFVDGMKQGARDMGAKGIIGALEGEAWGKILNPEKAMQDNPVAKWADIITGRPSKRPPPPKEKKKPGGVVGTIQDVGDFIGSNLPGVWGLGYQAMRGAGEGGNLKQRAIDEGFWDTTHPPERGMTFDFNKYEWVRPDKPPPPESVFDASKNAWVRPDQVYFGAGPQVSGRIIGSAAKPYMNPNY